MYPMSFFHKKNVTKCLGHHYAIWTSDSNLLLALISGTDLIIYRSPLLYFCLINKIFISLFCLQIIIFREPLY